MIISFELSAQQIAQHRNYAFNIPNQNPAAIAMSEIPDIMLNHKAQWLGFNGAPRVSSLYGKYIFRNDMGASASILNDRIGLTQKLNLNLNYAYILHTENFNLSFGFGWSFSQLKLLSTQITVYETNDQVLNLNANEKMWKPDANAGIIINSNSFFAGFSILQLLKSKFSFSGRSNDIPGLIRDSRHFFITGGYHININESPHIITPIVNLYFTKASPFKFDILANYSYNNTFSSSLGFSKSDAIVFSLAYKYNKFTINYAFDFVISRIRNVSSGTHEITLGVFLFDKKTNNITSPMF